MSVKFNLTKTAAVLAAVAATVAFAPSSAIAQERPVTIHGEAIDARIEMVSFARLDLNQQRDRNRLKSRVGGAIERVCLRESGRDGLQDRDYYACEGKAWDDAMPQIAAAVVRSSDLALGGGAASLAATAIRVSAR